jgi:hypothetical protein
LSNRLWSSVESGNSLVWRSILLLLLFVDGSMLDGLVIEGVVSWLLYGPNW